MPYDFYEDINQYQCYIATLFLMVLSQILNYF
jgi:hypothetical protein